MKVNVRQIPALIQNKYDTLPAFYAPNGLDDFSIRNTSAGVTLHNDHNGYTIKLSGNGLRYGGSEFSGDVENISIYNKHGLAISFIGFDQDINKLLSLLDDWQFSEFHRVFWNQTTTLSFTSTRNFEATTPQYYDNTVFDVSASMKKITYIGSSLNDYAITGAGHDILRGWAGNDQLLSGAGIDRVEGGRGNDDIRGGDGQDYLQGDDGIDQIYGDMGSDQIFGGNGNDSLHGDGNDVHAAGTSRPVDGTDRIYGGTGDDSVWGGDGDDRLFGGDGNDRIDDTYFSRSINKGSNDTIYGNAGDDTIKGDLGNDLVYGGTGHDYFDFYQYQHEKNPSESNSDTVTGGAGHDQYFIAANKGYLLIKDFNPRQDSIILHGGSYETQLGKTYSDTGEGVRFKFGNLTVLLEGVHMASLRVKVNGVWDYITPSDYFYDTPY